MKLVIICKDDTKNKKSENENLIIKCGICRGEDTKTTIKMIMEDYGDEIDEIVYPNCNIVKK
ncbi:hypothetical protein Mjas_07820 [Methanothermococcus sp. Ax23]|jgi:hypothetical protein|uniref:hypothetical protein n=1 Tax=Methanothermococcus sp. Ax23 TaxID=3156486 RepID=UPI003B9F1600